MASNKIDITKRSYDKIAKDWTKKEFAINRLVGEVKKFATYMKSGKKVLDVGCGPGKHAKELIKLGLEVTGIDFSKEMIKEAKIRVPKGNFRLMDMKNLKYKNNTFDGLLCWATILHIERKDVVPVLLEFRRVLKNKGILTLSVKKGKGEGFVEKYNAKRFFVYYNKNEIINLVKKSGFRILESEIKNLEDTWIIVFAEAMK